MNDDLQALQTNIEMRKKQIAAANSPEIVKAAEQQRQAALDQKNAQVATLNMAVTDAQNASQANHSKLVKATTARKEAEAADQKVQEAARQIDTLTADIEQKQREWELKDSQASRVIEPVEPSAADIRTIGDPIDNRAKWGLGTSAGIFA